MLRGHLAIKGDFLAQMVELGAVHGPDDVDIRVVQDHGRAFFFREQVHLGLGIGAFQEPRRGRGQEHVADLPQLADEDAPHLGRVEINGFHGCLLLMLLRA